MDIEAVENALWQWCPPESEVSLAKLNAQLELELDGLHCCVKLSLGMPCKSLHNVYVQQITDLLLTLGVSSVQVEINTDICPHENQNKLPALDQVSNVIAVSSGKGGVGKSTTAVNLALALQHEGARVGVLDADVFGPSLPLMLGLKSGQRPEVIDQRWMVPFEAHGLQVMSMGFLVDENTPVVWRGPKASGALQQLLTQTRWQKLDYLIVDMPPGTGDIQLTLAQKVPVAGSVVVTTPQDIALLDAVKGVEMFRKVGISVLGIVENMSIHICSQCGHTSALFGEGGGTRIAGQYDVPLLGQLPLSLPVREQGDLGVPIVAAQPHSREAKIYFEVARRMAATLAAQPKAARGFPAIRTEH